MATRSRRSRAVEALGDIQELPAGESVPENLADTLFELGSSGETSDLDIRKSQEIVVELSDQPANTLEKSQSNSPNATTQLEQILAAFMTAMEESNAQLRESIKSDLRSVRSDLSSVKSDLNASQAKFDQFQAKNDQFQDSIKKELQIHQEKFENFQTEVRSDLQFETQKLLKTFETQAQGLRKEFTDKLAAETRQVTQMVSQVQAETTAELVAVKRQLQVLRTEFDSRLDNSNTNTQVIVNELADKMQEHRAEVVVQLERQRESLETVTQANTQEVNRQIEQLNSKFLGIESRSNEITNRQILSLEACGVGHDANSPSVRPTSDQGTTTEVTEQSSGWVGGTVSCTHQSNPCQAVVSESSMNDCSVHANPNVNVSLAGYLNNSELPLPQFDDASETNPVLHLRRLDEFIQFKNIPKTLCLAIACRSMIGSLSKQWIEAIAPRLPNYEAFKEAFLNTWWSTSRQSLVKCTLYQTRYDRRSGLSLSAHFLKHVNMAAYLDSRPSDMELIEALRAHYPVGVQRAMLTNQLQTIEQALDLLRRVELMEHAENYQRPYPPTQNSQQYQRSGNNRNQSDLRRNNQAQVSKVQFSPSRNRSRGYRGRNHWNNYGGRDGESSGGSSGPLNPNVTPYQERQETDRHNDHHSGN
jgi:hypothetical protein